jgi:pSer/pThr/pTyr-binding forkhead associated (FHA) protein
VAAPSPAVPVSQPGLAPEEVPLIVVTDRQNGFRASYHLRASRNRIGRALDAEVPVPDDPAFSRTHATIALEHGEYRLTDAGSLNGTSLNGNRLPSRGSAVLHLGDRIEIGNRILTFSRASSETLLG